VVSNSTTGTLTLLETPAPATTLRVSTVPTTTTAGAAFKVVVSAVDGLGRLVTNFNGKVTFASTDAKAVLPLPYKFLGTEGGVKSFLVTLKTAGSQDITVTSGGIGGTDTIAVTAAAASQFTLTAPASAASGQAFDVTVTARDKFGNVATGYLGTVRFASSDTSVGLLLPPEYAFQASDNGVKTFSVTLIKPGTQTVTVIDKVKLFKKGASVIVT
jgi:hypothetical protein